MRTAAFLLFVLFLFTLFPSTLAAQAPAPFESCPQALPSVSNATIYVPGRLPTAGGDSLQAGDRIALFTDAGRCAGVGTWNSGAALALTAYGADPWSGFDGFDAQGALRFKVWDASRQAVHTAKGVYAACPEEASPPACRDDGRYAAGTFHTLAGFLPASLPEKEALRATRRASAAVQLTSFEATRERQAVVLRWQTASEVRSKGFEVQHAIAGATDAAGATGAAGDTAYARKAFVESTGAPGAGQSYSLRVEALPPGLHRFRLKQVDLDGNATLSSVAEVRVEMAESFSLSAPAPNPFSARATFQLAVQKEEAVTVAVYDLLGRRVALLHEGPLAAGTPHRFRFEGGSHASGLYLFRVTGESFQAVRKAMLVQ